MDSKGEWRLSLAHDLIFSSSQRGEQSTLVKGKGISPAKNNLLNLAPIAELSEKQARAIIEETRQALSSWEKLATEHGVSRENIRVIQKHIG